MNLISNNLNVDKGAYRAAKGSIFLLIVLYFVELVFNIMGSPLGQNSTYKIFLVLSFGAAFYIYLITFVIISSGRFSHTSLMVSLVTTLTLLIGFINQWYLTDIVGDALRFFAPLLAYFVGIKLFKKLNIDQIKIVFMRIMKGLSIIVLFNLFIKLFSMLFLGEPLVKYPNGGVDVPILLVSFFIVAWFYIKKPSISFSFFIIFIALLFIMNPIISASKAALITVAATVIFIPLFFGKFRHKFGAVIFISLGTLLIVSSELGMLLIGRFEVLLQLILNTETTSNVKDGSSFARLIELQSAIDGLMKSDFFPLSILFGSGSGSLWYSSVDIGTGLNSENFRNDGGAHHIHIELVSLLFRHGLLGLFIYLGWMFYIFKKSLYVFKYYYKKDIFLMSIAAAVALQMLTAFLGMLTDTSIYGHFTVGLISAIPVVLYSQIKLLHNNI